VHPAGLDFEQCYRAVESREKRAAGALGLPASAAAHHPWAVAA
jgi:hypothetical protein